MQTYNRTVWKDHIKDQNNNVIQQGTPVSAQNLNNIENQVVALSAKENVLAELVKETIPSGFTTLSDLDYTFMSTNPNQIKLISDSVAYVNGYKITIPAGTIITLDAPPTAGTRDDLVFLEVYKSTDVNGAEQLNCRLRVVDGVDFVTYTTDGFINNGGVGNPNIIAQGANVSPLTDQSYKFTTANGVNNSFVNKDIGLYIAGSTSAKTALGTVDGYVYAIPMFQIHRRNSGGFSANNFNGALPYVSISFTRPNITAWQTGQLTSVTNYASIPVGSVLHYAKNKVPSSRVLSNSGKGVLTVLNIGGNDMIAGSTSGYTISDRVDLLNADIIADRDIIDLRHKVSLTGFNYQQLLEENFDKLLRGELQTKDKTKMLKTYHGIPKTPIDANTIFYASFDGTTIAEVGGDYISANGMFNGFKLSPTGLGIEVSGGKNNESLEFSQFSSYSFGSSEITVDAGVFLNSLNFQSLLFCPLYIGFTDLYDRPNNLNGISALRLGYNHLRYTLKNGIAKLYINGVYIGQTSSMFGHTGFSTNAFRVHILSDFNGLCYSDKNWILSDLSISNIDRGANFATLPQDVIDGYARIAPAFNGQRQVFSDALTSQYTLEKITASTSGRGKQFATTQATAGQWTAGDTIKVKGLGGEIISGVVDSDTALAKVNNNTVQTTNTISLDDVSKLIVDDVIQLYNITLNAISIVRNITALDTVNKTITFDGSAVYFDGSSSFLVFETTASSSSPTMKANVTGTAQAGASSTITLPTTFNGTDDAYNGLDIMITSGTGAGQRRTISDYVGSTKVATVSSAWTITPDSTSQFIIYNVPVAGTWSGLGTNEATFTLGTLYGITNQDLQIEYSLNQVAGQGGISEVLTATLAGEANGKKLVVNPSVHIRDDFANKVSGDNTACPNSAYTTSASSLQTPTAVGWSEFAQGDYTNVVTLDGTCKSVSTTANGQQAQILIKKNIVRMVEDKFGTIPALDKVKWCKDNIASITANAYVFGSCPSSNKAYFDIFNYSANRWSNGWVTITNNTSTLAIIGLSTPSDYTDSNGMVNFVLHTDASDGVTPSQVNLDYAYIDIVLKTPTGYDTLVPENPRRDDGKANMLLVRKETKEIQCFMDASNTDGIVTYGDMIPDQSIAKQNGVVLATSDDLYLITGGTGGVSTGNYKNSSSRIGMSSINSNLTGTIINLESADTVTKAPIINEKLINKATTDGTSLIGKNIANNTSKVVTGIDLVKVNGEIYLKTRSKYDNSINVNNSTATTVDFKVENRILIK